MQALRINLTSIQKYIRIHSWNVAENELSRKQSHDTVTKQVTVRVTIHSKIWKS